jgi:hypothetical protein
LFLSGTYSVASSADGFVVGDVLDDPDAVPLNEGDVVEVEAAKVERVTVPPTASVSTDSTQPPVTDVSTDTLVPNGVTNAYTTCPSASQEISQPKESSLTSVLMSTVPPSALSEQR